MKVIGVMADIDKRLTANLGQGPQGFQEFRLKVTQVAVKLNFPDGGEFGILDQHSNEALKPLLEQPELDLNAFAEINAIRSTIARARRSTDAIIRVDINLNGPEALAQKIGHDLSNRKVWLQRPSTCTMKFPYRNPHVIEFPGIDRHDVLAIGGDNAQAISEQKQSFEDFQKTVAEVYDTLSRDKDLSRIEGDRRLKTQLLP